MAHSESHNGSSFKIADINSEGLTNDQDDDNLLNEVEFSYNDSKLLRGDLKSESKGLIDPS